MREGVSVLLLLLGLAGSRAQSPDPTFHPAPGSPFKVGSTPFGIAAADINGDGRPDLLAANRDSRDVTVLLGDGSGGFRPSSGSPIQVNLSPSFIAAGELNGDGRPDLVLAQHDGSYDVTVMFGDGAGGFVSAPGSPFRPLHSKDPHNHGLLLSDIDGDGKLDIVTANGGVHSGKGDNSLSILINDGKGSFSKAPRSPIEVGGLPSFIAAADMNGDGRIDLVAAHEGKRSLSILLADGRGGFAPAPGSPVSLPEYANSLALGDINNDGKMDIVTTREQSELLTVLLGKGNGMVEAAPGPPVDIGTHGWNASLAHMNGDRNLDLVVRGRNDTVVLLLGSGDGRFERATGFPMSVGRSPFSILVVDVNGDGRLDIVTANSADNNLSILLSGVGRR